MLVTITDPDGVVWEVTQTSQSGPPGCKGMQGNCGAIWVRRVGDVEWVEAFDLSMSKIQKVIEDGGIRWILVEKANKQAKPIASTDGGENECDL